MSCALGSLGIGNISFNISTGNYDSMSSNKLSTSPQIEDAFNLGVEGEATGEDIPSTKNEYWTINIPETGVKGNCNNTITVTAVVG